MDLWKSLNGMVKIELICADPATAISKMNAEGIAIYNAQREDEDIVAHFFVRRQDVRRIKALAEKQGYELTISNRWGIYWLGKKLLQRPVLTVGALLFFIIATFLPTRVLFLEIEGNTNIPKRLIVEKCYECGISFGASRRQIKSEKMKNRLLQAIPELQWAGINTYGCRAVITVRERAPLQLPPTECSAASIVARRDGVITEITATNGNQICKVGQAVKAGEVLISGYTDCGIVIQATHAKGEVYAATKRDLTAVLPLKWQSRMTKNASQKKYSVIIGKKRINFYKGSGISDTTCDKMYEESYVTLPGGFRLPIILVKESWTYYDHRDVTLPEPSLSGFADQYLSHQMIAGKVVSRLEDGWTDGALYKFQGNYACTEMIGQVRSEETIKPYE